MSDAVELCEACCRPAQGNFSIHRDGFGWGPEVPLCNACGEKSIPTELEIWAAIRARRIVAGLCVGLDDTRCLVHEGFELDEDDGICARGRREIYDCGCSCVKVAHGLCDVYDGCGLERTRERAGDVE